MNRKKYHDFRTSCWYGLLGFIPGFLLALFATLDLFRVAGDAYRQVVYSSGQAGHALRQAGLIEAIFAKVISYYEAFLRLFSDDGQSFFFYSVISVLLAFLFVFLLHIINPQFSLRGFSFKRWWHSDKVFSSVRIAEYFFLSLLGIVLLGRFLMQYSFPLAVISGVLIFFFFWHEQGLWGDLRIFDYSAEQKPVHAFGQTHSPWTFSKNLKEKRLGRLFFNAILASALMLFISRFIEFVLDYPALLQLFLVSYRSWFSAYDYAGYYLLAFSILGVMLPMIFLIESRSFVQFKQRTIVPVLLVAVFGGATFYKNFYWMKAVDLPQNVFELATLEEGEGKSQTLLIIDGDGQQAMPIGRQGIPIGSQVRVFHADVNLRGVDLDNRIAQGPGDPRLIVKKTPCSEVNNFEMKNVGENLAEKFFVSILTDSYLGYFSGKPGFGLVYGCRLFAFDIVGILNDKIEAMRHTVDDTELITFLGRTGILAQPISRSREINAERLMQYVEERPNLSPELRNLYADWLYYNGYLEKAAEQYQQVAEALLQQSGASEQERGKKIAAMQETALRGKFFEGKISGKIIFSEQDLQESVLKVALLRKKDVTNQRTVGISTADLANGVFLEGYSLMAAEEIQPDGSFLFDDVIEGNYVLAFLFVDEKLDLRVEADFSGEIEVSKENNQAVLGEVRVGRKI